MLPAMDTHFEPLDIKLRNERVVHVRAIVPSDEEEILQAFERMSSQSRYMRFMHSVREANRKRLREVLASFPGKGLAIAATIPAADGIDIVGSATFIIGPGPETCEFAINVAQAWGGAGLGRELMTALIDAARRRGLREMDGFVLAENQPMLRLAARLGFAVARDPDDYAVRVCRLTLG
jgi:acetyltransferase